MLLTVFEPLFPQLELENSSGRTYCLPFEPAPVVGDSPAWFKFPPLGPVLPKQTNKTGIVIAGEEVVGREPATLICMYSLNNLPRGQNQNNCISDLWTASPARFPFPSQLVTAGATACSCMWRFPFRQSPVWIWGVQPGKGSCSSPEPVTPQLCLWASYLTSWNHSFLLGKVK